MTKALLMNHTSVWLAFPNRRLLPEREKYNKYPDLCGGASSAAADRT